VSVFELTKFMPIDEIEVRDGIQLGAGVGFGGTLANTN
jgi:hypothetical protein